ncbi:uncharacterized protein BKA78DRAFT_379499 [Phyllosticta capitalensis]|uniref:uncharacterized protein n=1 Tax=Phyllosticta capitalensis TaxID=121624 RepID=UPI003132305B
MPAPQSQGGSEAAQLSASQSAWYRCRHCSDSFKREDHLRRHELSHGFPRFLCDHNGCGMRFHRKDVLQRHKLVHQPNPLKRRRKPRRGPIPHGPIQQAGGATSWSGEDSAEGSATSPDASHPPLHQSEALATDILTNLPGVQVSNGHGAGGRMPVDPLSAQSFDTFNLANEWSYGLDDWPDYTLPFDGYNVRSWQDYAMPNFETAVTADVLPFFALAHNPNANFAAAAMPAPVTLPLNSQDMVRCVNAYRRGVLPRHPFLHHVTCEMECLTQNSALYYAMAMAGAMELDQYRSKAEKLHKLAIQELEEGTKSVIAQLRDIQARILLIEFGIWYGDDNMRRWARRERHNMAQNRVEFLQDHFLPLDYNNWPAWRRREEMKRTAFAFVVCSIVQTFYYDEEFNITAEKVEMTLPCPDTVWEATTEEDWRREVANLSLHEKAEINFPAAAHAILSRDTAHFTDYELATVFGQQILLAVICDTFNTAHRLRNNYTSLAAWEARDMGAFRLRESLDGALVLWADLWWAPVEHLWDHGSPTLPKAECQILHQYARVRVNRNRNFAQNRPAWTYKAVDAAVEAFSSISKTGFTEVATHAPTIFSVSGYYMCTELARVMLSYLTTIALPSYAPLTPRDNELVTRIRQAVRRHTTSAPFTRFSSTLGAVPRPGSCIGHMGTALSAASGAVSTSTPSGSGATGETGGSASSTTSPATSVHAVATPILPSNTNTAGSTGSTSTASSAAPPSAPPSLQRSLSTSSSARSNVPLKPALPGQRGHHSPPISTSSHPAPPPQSTLPQTNRPRTLSGTPTLASAVAASAASSSSSLATLARQVDQLWTIGFGGDDWKSMRTAHPARSRGMHAAPGMRSAGSGEQAAGQGAGGGPPQQAQSQSHGGVGVGVGVGGPVGGTGRPAGGGRRAAPGVTVVAGDLGMGGMATDGQ